MGAYHALTFALRRADLFPLSISLSGNYDPSSWHGWGEQGEAAYFANPVHFVPGLGGEHLDWLRSRLSVLLVVGQGMWEDTTGALPSSRTSGVTTSRTTGRPGSGSSRTTCPVSADPQEVPRAPW